MWIPLPVIVAEMLRQHVLGGSSGSPAVFVLVYERARLSVCFSLLPGAGFKQFLNTLWNNTLLRLCLRFSGFNRAAHKAAQQAAALFLNPASPPFPNQGGLFRAGDLVDFPCALGAEAGRVQAGGGLRSEGVAGCLMSWRQAAAEGALCWQPSPSSPACTQRRRHAGSCRQLRPQVTAQLGWLCFFLLYFLFSPRSPFSLPPKELGRREDGWS